MNSKFCIKEYQNIKSLGGKSEDIAKIPHQMPSLSDSEQNDDDLQDTGRKSNESRLQDIENQLELAETRCNSLKDQLDYMKQAYGGTESNDNSCSNDDNDKSFLLNKTNLNRQKSSAIETDTTGAAVKTINNILNGITNSVNRLSEIHSQMTTPRAKMSAKETTTIPELKINSHAEIQNKIQKMKAKSHRIQNSSQVAFKKTSKLDKKPKTSISRSAAILEKKSSTLVKTKYFARKFSKGNNLVEIYHNDAVKHSDSDESNMKKSRQQERMGQKMSYEVPPLHIDEPDLGNNSKETSEEKKDSSKTCHTYQNGYNHDLMHQPYFDPPQAPRTMSCCYSKNYELPTVASKMKQVAKRYLGSLNLKTIPFCAAISTTQSHNIGINIQQVLNIIKNRQPINGISPTLAHNIGLAAEKLNCKPFSALVSTINSRISQTASKCPLSKTFLNFQQLQEQARTIPEEIIEEVDEELIETPETKVLAITGPSGDTEVKTKNLPVWRIDKNTNNEQCTCLVPSNVTFQQIATKYQKNNRTISDNNINSQVLHQIKPRKFKSIRNRLSNGNVVVTETQYHPVQNKEYSESQLKGREKNLKEVLTNLHDDFEYLNKKYEELCVQNSSIERNEDSLHELERLETELNKKEEEITMVMTLYKEVMALKQQVRQLKERKSQASISKETKTKFKDYNNPEAAFHLTKLLKQIQHYQSRYKSNLGAE
ncbi:uncharacterized protein LOC143198215 isoform X2 [Rhynchophorus ferrugineus]|uniref:uncharacterized protein LOC143198215 isoform X2 n=1 Tax=Rhynchophorus ferrugineus TaxID=354439 RepID=UPI003FCCC878